MHTLPDCVGLWRIEAVGRSEANADRLADVRRTVADECGSGCFGGGGGGGSGADIGGRGGFRDVILAESIEGRPSPAQSMSKSEQCGGSSWQSKEDAGGGADCGSGCQVFEVMRSLFVTSSKVSISRTSPFSKWPLVSVTIDGLR